MVLTGITNMTCRVSHAAPSVPRRLTCGPVTDLLTLRRARGALVVVTYRGDW